LVAHPGCSSWFAYLLPSHAIAGREISEIWAESGLRRASILRLTLHCDSAPNAIRGGHVMPIGCLHLGPTSRNPGSYMPELLSQYLPLVIFVAIAALIGGVLLVVPFVVAFQSPDSEKLSAYECGFNAFDDARMKFDVRFYLVSLLFIIFDLEVIFLFPWALAFKEVGFVGFWSMMAFLGVLTIGFVYEWRKGALEWD
jgi:NADH-quinone oxidoreductase subunit A